MVLARETERSAWIPACAGMTVNKVVQLYSTVIFGAWRGAVPESFCQRRAAICI